MLPRHGCRNDESRDAPASGTSLFPAHSRCWMSILLARHRVYTNPTDADPSALLREALRHPDRPDIVAPLCPWPRHMLYPAGSGLRELLLNNAWRVPRCNPVPSCLPSARVLLPFESLHMQEAHL